MMTNLKERKDIRPLLVKFGVALALSFAGFIYSRIQNKHINPSDSPTPPSDCDRKIEYEGRFRVKEDSQAETNLETTDSHDKPCVRVCVESSSKKSSPSFRCSGDKDVLLLPEFDQLVREFNVSPTKSDMKAFKIAMERNECDQEIESLRKKVKSLEKHIKILENRILEYYGLQEEEPSKRELQSRLKLSNVESKILSMKIDSLQANNKKLEAQVADYSRVVSELDVAKAKIRLMKRRVRLEAQQSKEQILDLTRRVVRLGDQEHESSTSEMESIGDLEGEAEELRKANEKLLNENFDLAQKLEYTQILANSVLEDTEKEEVNKVVVHLREENKHLTEKVDILQADRCADAEELVYLRWINACLRYELRNYQPPPGKTVARDLSKTLSPKSEEKAKQLILEYDGERPADVIDLDFDHLTDTSIDSPTRKPASKKMNFLSNLIKVIRGKSSQPQKNKSGKTSPLHSAEVNYNHRRSGSRSPMLASSSQNSTGSSMDQNRMSDGGVRFVLERRNSSALDYFRPEDVKCDEKEGKKTELAKYAEVLRGSRRVHKRCSSAYL